MDNGPCLREHIRAIVPSWNTWTLKPNGEPECLESLGDCKYAFQDEIEEYQCDNCGQCFIAEKQSVASAQFAWNEALAHLAEVAELLEQAA